MDQLWELSERENLRERLMEVRTERKFREKQ